MDEETWLDPAILEYIKTNNGKVDSVDVISHFGLRCDITLFAIKRLKDSGKIEEKRASFNVLQPMRLFVKEA